MLKLMLVLFALFIGFRVFLHFLVMFIKHINSYNNHYGNHNDNQFNKSTNNNTIQNLVKCDYCGVYVILEHTIDQNGKNFCCKEHAKQKQS